MPFSAVSIHITVSSHDYCKVNAQASRLFFYLAGFSPVFPSCLRSRAFPPHLMRFSEAPPDCASFLRLTKAMSFTLNECLGILYVTYESIRALIAHIFAVKSVCDFFVGLYKLLLFV